MAEIQTTHPSKSSAPLILGIIGFCVNLPGLLCTYVCAGVAGGLSDSSTSGFSSEAADKAAGSVTALTMIFWLAGFIMAFLGKSKKSFVFGVISMLSGAALIGLAAITMNLFGFATGILYIIGGLFSCKNAKRG